MAPEQLSPGSCRIFRRDGETRDMSDWEEKESERRRSLASNIDAGRVPPDVQPVFKRVDEQIKRRDFVGARRVATSLSDPVYRDYALAQVAQAQSNKNDVPGAIQTIRTISFSFQRLATLHKIADDQLSQSRVAAARKCANAMRQQIPLLSTHTLRSNTYEVVASLYLSFFYRSHSPTDLRVARSLSNNVETSERKTELLLRIALCEGNQKQIRALASEMLSALTPTSDVTNDDTLNYLFQLFLETKDFHNAYVTTKRLHAPPRRATALATLAVVHARIGDKMIARRLIEETRKEWVNLPTDISQYQRYDSHMWAVRALANLGEFAEAEKVVREISDPKMRQRADTLLSELRKTLPPIK